VVCRFLTLDALNLRGPGALLILRTGMRYSIELESDNLITLRQFEADLLHWRKKGAVGKPHHVAKIFRVSTQRTEAFKRHAKEMEDEERCLQVVGGVECRARA